MFLNTLSSIICDLTDPNDVSPQKEGRIDLGETAFALDCLLIEKISLSSDKAQLTAIIDKRLQMIMLLREFN